MNQAIAASQMNADFREAILDVNLDAERKGYQQALTDFCVVDLIAKIGVCSDTNRMELEPQEREALAALFVKRLTDNLTEKTVNDYFNVLRYGLEDVLPNPISIEVSPPCNLTPNFADALTPRFLEGTRVRWVSVDENREWGVILGRFYAFAPHHYRWTWRYVVLLDSDTPSAKWITSDTAWEDDLAPLEGAA
jgi:hypothetical protein